MKKKIMIVIPSIKGGGAERVTINIANNLDINKFEVTIVSCTSGNEYIRYIEKHINIVELNKSTVKQAIFSIKNEIKKNKPDIILSVMEHTYVSTILAQKLSCHKCKMILAIHSTYSNSLKYSNIKSKASLLDKISKILKVYKYCDKIVFVSRESCEDFINYFKIFNDKSKVIYNPIIFDNINILKDENIELDNNYKYILSVGRLTKAKDHKNLINSIDYIVNEKNRRDIKLIIVGKGELENELKELAEHYKLKENIIFWGFEENPFKFMNKCDVFVLSSIFEGLPTVLVEAMYCGAIVISTDCKSGPKEIITDGLNGYLVPVSNSIKLGDKIISVLNNEQKNNENIRKNAIDRAKDFHVRECVMEYEQLFEQLI